MSTNRSEDRASLGSFRFVDGRDCRLPRRHGPCVHAGIPATPASSMIYFVTSGYRWGGVQLKNLTTLLGKGSTEGTAVIASLRCL
jgi:hypothetical protein